MKQNIVEIQVPAGLSEAPEDAQGGVMYEHNATALRFLLDPVYIAPEYRYYLEFVTVNGVNRTDYLTPDEENAIEFSIPADITSQMTALCCLNIVSVNEDGKTEQLIKSKSVNLYFSVFENTEKKLAADYAFSVNALLEAIENGTFKGDKGDQGEQGEKGDKGDKGDPGVTVDSAVTETSQNPVASAGIFECIRQKRERVLVRFEVGEGESVAEVSFSKDLQDKSFLASEVKIYAHLVYASSASSCNLRISTDGGMRYLTYLPGQAPTGTLDVFVTANASELFTAALSIYGTASQGTVPNNSYITISDRVKNGFSDLRLSLNEEDGAVRIPLLPGSKILMTGTDMYE